MAEKHEFDERIRKQIEADNKRAEEDRKMKSRLQEEKARMEKEEAEEEKRILEARKERIFKQKILEYQKKRLIINRKNAAVKIQKWWRIQLRIVQFNSILRHNFIWSILGEGSTSKTCRENYSEVLPRLYF